MLISLQGGEPDYIPCSFMLFHNLWNTCHSKREYIEKQVALGLDAYVPVGHLEHSLHPDAQSLEWTEQHGNELVFCRRIDTPAGPLTSRVVQRNGWPENHPLPLFDDWLIPRSEKFLVDCEQDLEKVPYLFGPFRDEHVKALQAQAQESDTIAREHNLLQVGGWQALVSPGVTVDYGVMGADALSWLSGYVPIMELSLRKPELVTAYLDRILSWNLKQIELFLDLTNADLIIRRGWYETCEFWTPGAFKTIIAPTIQKEAALVHQAGKLYGYIITSAFLPLLDDIVNSGVDVIIGIDPEEGKGTHLSAVKERFSEKGKALWGGVSGAMTVELGTQEGTEKAVLTALEILGERGGFILSPVDNVRENTEKAWMNTHAFINTWKKYHCI